MAPRIACVMVGPAPDAQGGVASVIAVYREGGLFDDGSVRLLASYRAGGALTKLGAAAGALLRYAGVLLGGGGDVLHVHVSSRASFWRKALFIGMARLARRRVVFHLHGGGFRPWVEGLPAPTRALVIGTLRSCDVLLCLTSAAGDWLRAVAPGVPVRWWPNPVPAALFVPAPDQAQRDPMVLFLGALTDAKGTCDLIQAFSVLQRTAPEARLVLAGTGPALDVLQALCRDLGIGDAVTFPGWVGPVEKAELLRRARIFCLPSHVEAQPMVLLEALAAGTAIVSTWVGGVPDMLTDRRDALLVPPREPPRLGEALQALWNDAGMRETLVAQGQARVATQHRADQVCVALRSLYETLGGEMEQSE
jgi:glycosyltransferase involved in cell wall biosynthesis